MSLPRKILPGASYLVTRRCAHRLFRLRPSRRVNELIRYCLAVAAERHGMLVHAMCALSDHYHLVVTDPEARLPGFMSLFDVLVARCLNAMLGRWEGLWASGSYSAVELIDEPAMIDKIGYTLANPVISGLVREGHQWPGLRLGLGVDDVGATFEARRPYTFFRENGPMPAAATLTLSRPPTCQSDADLAVFAQAVRDDIARRENEARRVAARLGRSFLGRRAVLAQSIDGRPSTREPRRTLSPRLACHDPSRRIEAIGQLRAFVAAYRSAWRRFKEGVREVLFPAGTYGPRVFLGVRCAPL